MTSFTGLGGTTPIAIRRMIRRMNGSDQPVAIYIFAPECLDPDTWTCGVQVDGLSVPYPVKRSMAGDAVQALKYAVRQLEVWFDDLPEVKAGEIFFSDGSPYGLSTGWCFSTDWTPP